MKNINPLLYSFNDNDDISDLSSNIECAKYCDYTRTLVLKFKGGAIYLYSSMPPSVYRSFCISESKGTYFYRKIRGVYPYLKIPTS